MEHDKLYKKLEVSEGQIRERDSRLEEHNKPVGYEQHPADEKSYEVFGLKNSFDDLSVSSDEKGRLTLAVSSQKAFHSPVPDNTKRKLRGSRRRTVYEHFGEFFTEPASRGRGAFAFRTRKNLSEVRILREFRNTAIKHIEPEQSEALPLLTVEKDKKLLSEMRSRDGRTSADVDERLAVGQRIIKKTEYENRFIRKLRIARRQTLFIAEPVTDDLLKASRSLIDNADNGDDAGEDTEENKDEN